MFNTTNVKGDDLPGAMARLLCERPGEWFTYTSHGRPRSVATALIVDVDDDRFYHINGHSYSIDPATREKLMTVLNKHNAAQFPSAAAAPGTDTP